MEKFTVHQLFANDHQASEFAVGAPVTLCWSGSTWDVSHFSLVSCSGIPTRLLVVPALKQLSGTSAALNFMSTLLLTAFASRRLLGNQPTHLELAPLCIFTHSASLGMGHLLLVKRDASGRKL